MRATSALLASIARPFPPPGSLSSQATGQNYLVRTFGAGQSAISFCYWFKVNSWNKGGTNNDLAFSCDNATVPTGYVQSAALGDSFDGTAAEMNFGTYDGPTDSSQSTTYGVTTTLGSWRFAAFSLTGTALVFHSGAETGALTTNAFTAPGAASAMTRIVLCQQLFTAFEFPGHFSIRAAKLWLGQTLDATAFGLERASFAPVQTTGLDSYLALLDPAAPGTATTGTSWTVGGSFAGDTSAPDLTGL